MFNLSHLRCMAQKAKKKKKERKKTNLFYTFLCNRVRTEFLQQHRMKPAKQFIKIHCVPKADCPDYGGAMQTSFKQCLFTV